MSLLETVMLVEDEPDVRGLATELFRSIGYETVEASSASETAEIMRERADIDVVFTDIAMPHGISGVNWSCWCGPASGDSEPTVARRGRIGSLLCLSPQLPYRASAKRLAP